MENLSYKLVTSNTEQEGSFAVRRQVFIEEQSIPEEIELDEYEEESLYLVVKDGEDVIGTARFRFPEAGLAKIERMAILKPFRRMGIGSRIMSFLIEELSKRGVEQVVLHAQYSVRAFYGSCGFEETGSPFLEADIKHIKMQRRL